MKKLLIIFFTLISIIINAQNSFTVKIIDSENNNPLTGVTILLKGTNNGSNSDINGLATLDNIPNGENLIQITSIGYEKQEIKIIFPRKNNETHVISIQVNDEEIDEVIIESTRGNKTIANLPTRTEVLTDEIDEAASMEASKISHLITHSTGIQVQTTASGSNGKVVRIQGLNGRYTQILKDGFPLYGGISSSLDVLQIPPLDLRQVEYIKGSASTFYGGGAISGVINLLTKTAKKDETLLHINLSHIGAKDFNMFTSKKFGKWGFTNLASMHLHSPYDPNNDGYSDIAQVSKYNFNPKLFYHPNNKTSLYLGATISQENRTGGSIYKINNKDISPEPEYFLDKQESNRLTTQFSAHYKLNNNTIRLKNSISSFDRYINIDENILGTSTKFGGNQLNSYTELNYNINKEKQNINIGLNVITDKFKEDTYFYSLLPKPRRDQEYQTIGAYINHLWKTSNKFSVESGIRTDRVKASSLTSNNEGKIFILPKIGVLYKMSSELSVRLGGGMGYRMPTIFNEEAEPYGYKNIQPINFNELEPEESYGTNIDFKYQSTFNKDNILLTLNQMFFYNRIDNPIILNEEDIDILFYEQTHNFLFSKGFESQIKLTLGKFTWFFGYTYTDAYLENKGISSPLTLTPKHSIKGDLLFVEDNKWRIGWDYDYKSSQLIKNGNAKTASLFSTGIVVERTIDNFVIFLNAENFTDVRQSNYEYYVDQQFREVWAPLDGFFFNAGIKIKL